MVPELYNQIQSIFHKESPYAKFNPAVYPLKLTGGQSQKDHLKVVISEVQPSTIFEIGAYHGKSTVEMCDILDGQGQDDCIIASIDTWLGGVEQIELKDDPDPSRQIWYSDLGLIHGYPTIYFQFLANIMHRSYQDKVIPLPMTSSTAAALLRKSSISADLVYIDGSHQEDDVHSDLIDYSTLLTPGGVMCGDDYDKFGIKRALDKFMDENPLIELQLLDERFWVVRIGQN